MPIYEDNSGIFNCPTQEDLIANVSANRGISLAAAQALIEAYQATESSVTGARAWYEGHPNAEAFFTLSIDDFDAAIDALDLSPLATGTRNSLRLLFKIMRHTLVILARRENLIE